MTQQFAGDLRAQLADRAGQSAQRLQVATVAGMTRTLARTGRAESGSSRTGRRIAPPHRMRR